MAKRQQGKRGMVPIRPGTPEMEAHLSVGYGGMTVADAKHITKTYAEDPRQFPYSEVQRAQAFLKAYESEAIPIATEKVPRDRRPMRAV